MAINVLDPVSSIMTRDLITVHPKDTLADVKEIFDNRRIHHIPVVEFKKIVGIISKSDLLHYQRANQTPPIKDQFEAGRLKSWTVGEVMTKGLAVLGPEERIDVALEVFNENLFHCIPIVDGEELVGMLTTYDVIRALSK